jgi:hypothetical protein
MARLNAILREHNAPLQALIQYLSQASSGLERRPFLTKNF